MLEEFAVELFVSLLGVVAILVVTAFVGKARNSGDIIVETIDFARKFNLSDICVGEIKITGKPCIVLSVRLSGLDGGYSGKVMRRLTNSDFALVVCMTACIIIFGVLITIGTKNWAVSGVENRAIAVISIISGIFIIVVLFLIIDAIMCFCFMDRTVFVFPDRVVVGRGSVDVPNGGQVEVCVRRFGWTREHLFPRRAIIVRSGESQVLLVAQPLLLSFIVTNVLLEQLASSLQCQISDSITAIRDSAASM